MRSDELLELLKPLYVLTDSVDYWQETFSRHLKGDLNRQPIARDLAIFTKSIKDCLRGMVGVYLDDTMATWMREFDEASRLTERTFDSKGRSYDNVSFAGIEIMRTKQGYIMHQGRYADKLMALDTNADFDAFRSLRHHLA